MKMRNSFSNALVVVAVASTVCAQSAPDPRRILGRPATELYQPEPNIAVTVNYDREGRVCEIRLNGYYSKIRPLAEKLVPANTRGRQLGLPQSLIPIMNCCDSWRYDYENVVMLDSAGGGNDNVRFIFKGRECAVAQPNETRVPR
jgi:hypothetical protein